MNCRGCGRRIPESYLKLDSFECPYCGRRYRRTTTQAANSVGAQRAGYPQPVRRNARHVPHRKAVILEKVKRIAFRRIWKLPLIAWVAVILLVGIVGNTTTKDRETEKYAQIAADSAQVETEFERTLTTLESATNAPAIATETPEITAQPIATAVAAVNKVSAESLCVLIESVVAQNFEYYNVSAKDNIITVNLWQDGIAAALTLSSALGSSEISEQWNYVKQSMTSLANSICGLIDTAGRDDVVLNLNVLNDQNLDMVLLTLYDTYIIYDVLSA